MTPSSVTPHVAQPLPRLRRKPLQRIGVMLVFRHKQRDEDIHVEKTDHD